MRTHYRIIVEGLLHKRWWPRFKEMEIMYEGKNTVLTGRIGNTDVLQKMLSDLRSMSFALLMVEKTES